VVITDTDDHINGDDDDAKLRHQRPSLHAGQN
jgi:hypothetical protein